MLKKREELAWAAGFFDGEGCFLSSIQISHNSPYRNINANLAQKERAVLLRFRNIVGFGNIGKPNKNNASYWYCQNFEEVQAVGALLWFSLSSPKRKQFTKTIKNYLVKFKPKRRVTVVRDGKVISWRRV